MSGQTLDVAGFFAERLTHSHPDRSLDLALDRERVDRMAAIERGPDLVDSHRSGGIVHADFDHLGGVRTAFHEGATVVTHRSNREFYKQEVLTYATRTLDPDRLSLYPPTEFAEGYQLETIDMKGTISDGTRNLDVYYVQGSPHAEGMLMAYLPRERILVEADIYTPPAPDAQMPATPPPAAVNLYNNVTAYKLDVATIAALHGRAVPWSDFLRFVGKAGTN